MGWILDLITHQGIGAPPSRGGSRLVRERGDDGDDGDGAKDEVERLLRAQPVDDCRGPALEPRIGRFGAEGQDGVMAMGINHPGYMVRRAVKIRERKRVWDVRVS